MCDNSVDDFLLFFFWHIIDGSRLMELCLTSSVSFDTIKDLVDINLLVTAAVVVHRTKWSRGIHLDFGACIMVAAETHLCNWIVLLASATLKKLQVWPDLPIDLFPRNSISFSDKGYKFFQIPVFIDHMTCPHLTVRINKVGSFSAGKDFALLFSEELVAVCALVQVIFVFLEQ